jgi:hypothetical protein
VLSAASSRAVDALGLDHDSAILAAYQHMIAHPLYLPDYTLGHMMSHQIRSYMRGKDLAAETKRITSLGSLTPDLYFKRRCEQQPSPNARETRPPDLKSRGRVFHFARGVFEGWATGASHAVSQGLHRRVGRDPTLDIRSL